MPYPNYNNGYLSQYPLPSNIPQYSPPVNGYIQVAGVEGAQAYHLGPNSRVPAFDTNSDIFYDISTDANGNKSITPYTFVKMELPTPESSEYATKQDLAELNNKLDRLLEVWDGQQSVSEA